MKVLVFGATGKTGGLVVERALAKGHEVSVLVRDPGRFKVAGVRVLAGDATKAHDVLDAVRGQDVVIDTIGGTTPYKTTVLESSSVQNMIAAMRAEGVRRLLVVSMMGIGESREQAPFWYKHLLMTTFLRGSTKDKAAMEDAVRASGLEYVILRPPILKDGPATGSVVVIGKGEIGHSVVRADLANFLVDQVDGGVYLGEEVTLVNQ
ncbi:NAD(P)-dependent oxidoreductase [Granulicella arctica]|uniref:Putative NADH-flavin reductase n=1 Tax=Granulicella arctica TaxID=940613 RepID=A0A7Y9TGY4_9BACT|nr:NAD(P)H-binding protein [Granulicella arctica]NYF79974.1 putative NADH-flavin reductase [Granulicella arctica]